jgi:hypothetical protein
MTAVHVDCVHFLARDCRETCGARRKYRCVLRQYLDIDVVRDDTVDPDLNDCRCVSRFKVKNKLLF